MVLCTFSNSKYLNKANCYKMLTRTNHGFKTKRYQLVIYKLFNKIFLNNIQIKLNKKNIQILFYSFDKDPK